MSSSRSSIPDSFGMPDSYVSQGGSTSGGPGVPIESAKELYEKRKIFLKTATLQDDVSEYHVEHLLDQAVDRKAGILNIEDCIRKMKILNARGKIWSQEMCLRVDSSSIKFVDHHNNEELETFPIQSVQQCKAMTDPDSNFKHLCGIIEKHSDQKVPEIHLFHCPTIPATIIAADINSAVADSKSKKSAKSRPETMRQNRERIAKMYRDNVDVQGRIKDWDEIVKSNTADEYSYVDKQPQSPRSIPTEDESPEVQAYKINRDVLILNHTLDDIEHFVATIRWAAEAAQELTIRKSVKKSKKPRKDRGKNSERGMGILQLRSRLPPPEAYRECFQKFKFSFNLMGKLKKHLENPNSVELVHFLFKPLEIVISSCDDKQLASQVMTPLLLPETIEFLGNCCTSHEVFILTELGKYWNMPRSSFSNDVFFPPFYPRFRSGWQPPPPYNKTSEYTSNELNAFISDQVEQREMMRLRNRQMNEMRDDEQRRVSDVNDLYNHHQQQASKPISRAVSAATGATSPEAYKEFVQKHIRRNKEANGLPASPLPPTSARKLCRAMHDFEARSKYELSVDREDLLDVIDDSQSWWKVRNNYGQEGLVPGDLMLLISSANTNQLRVPVSALERPSSPPVMPYVEQQPVINIPPPPPTVTPPLPKSMNQQHPIARITAVDIKKPLRPVSKNHSRNPSNGTSPPPSQDPTQSSFDQRETSVRNRKFLQEELKERISAQRQRNFVIKSSNARSNEIQLSGDSSPTQVKQWLRSRGFSPLTVESLGVLNGSEIFRLTKDDLIKVCEGEASRVHSQLLVQMSGSRVSKFEDAELKEIMKRRRDELSAKGMIA